MFCLTNVICGLLINIFVPLTWESDFACFPAEGVEVRGVLLHKKFRGTGRELLLHLRFRFKAPRFS